MTTVIRWYDVLGVLPDAAPEDIREYWQAREALLEPGMLAVQLWDPSEPGG